MKFRLCHNVVADDRLSMGATVDALMSPFTQVCQYGGDTHAGEFEMKSQTLKL
jgi:hypothetical protein